MSVRLIGARSRIRELRAKRTFSPISSALLLLPALAACSSGPVQEQAEEGAIPVDCAIGPGSELAADCFVELAGDTLVVRHPDGSFRRLLRRDGGLSAADGAGELVVERANGMVEIAIEGDRYRWREGRFDAR